MKDVRSNPTSAMGSATEMDVLRTMSEEEPQQDTRKLSGTKDMRSSMSSDDMIQLYKEKKRTAEQPDTSGKGLTERLGKLVNILRIRERRNQKRYKSRMKQSPMFTEIWGKLDKVVNEMIDQDPKNEKLIKEVAGTYLHYIPKLAETSKKKGREALEQYPRVWAGNAYGGLVNAYNIKWNTSRRERPKKIEIVKKLRDGLIAQLPEEKPPPSGMILDWK